jgi:hypothetical protein
VDVCHVALNVGPQKRTFSIALRIGYHPPDRPKEDAKMKLWRNTLVLVLVACGSYAVGVAQGRL